MEIYVYYRAPVANDAALSMAVSAAQRALESRHQGLQARLLRRPDVNDGQATWMEIYRHAQGVDAALEGAIEAALRAALKGLGAGERHVERFQPCAS